MPELGSYGSVRGAAGNSRSYRERRQHGTLRKLNWPASKKRQGTKSREVGRRLSRERYGDLMLAQGSMKGGMLTGFDLRVCMYGR